MATNLAVREAAPVDQGFRLSQEDVEVIKATIAPKATDAELKQFVRLCETYHLDPFRGELVFQKYQNKDGTTKVSHITSRDGYLRSAMRHPDYAGLQSMPVREGDEFAVDPIKAELTHRFGAKRGALIGAWAIAHRRGFQPVIAFVDFQEYRNANAQKIPWQQYPSAMIQKVAEIAALRRQFNISGLITREEIPTLDEPPDLIEGEVLPPNGESAPPADRAPSPNDGRDNAGSAFYGDDPDDDEAPFDVPAIEPPFAFSAGPVDPKTLATLSEAQCAAEGCEERYGPNEGLVFKGHRFKGKKLMEESVRDSAHILCAPHLGDWRAYMKQRREAGLPS